MDFGGVLRDARHRLGLTQQELAERTGLSLGAVRDLEQGRSSQPRSRSLRSLAGVLGLDLDCLAPIDPPPARRPRPAPEPAEGAPRVRVLGPLEVYRAGRPVPLGSGRLRTVLARLAMTPHHPVSRAELIDLLWADAAPATAENVLQTHVSRLRRTLWPDPYDGATPLERTPGGYRLDFGEDGLDLLAYQARLAESRRLTGTDQQRAFDVLTEALDLWYGDDAAEDVAELRGDPLVTGLADELVDAVVRLARLGEALRRLPEVLPRLRRLARRHPWHEPLHARLVGALAATGQQAAALEAYDRIRDRLAGELGIDPGAELVDVRQGVLERRWESHARVHATATSRGPAPPRDFTGRIDELVRLERLLVAGRVHDGGAPGTVCVVSGMPGVGKTSLALRAAERVGEHFPDGLVYLDLGGADRAPLEPETAIGRLLVTLGVPDGRMRRGRQVRDDGAAAGERYRAALAGRRVLLLLDDARSAAQVRPLVPGTPGSAVLVTSRDQCAELAGAHRLDLPVLSTGEALDLLDRLVGGGRVAADLGVAAALVDACGRLPGALRLVADRLGVRPEWTLRGLLDRLDARGGPMRPASGIAA